MTTFGEKLKELRTVAGLSQAGLADASGVPIGTIRDYEQGKRDPLLSTAQKLAGAFGRGLEVFNGVTPGAQGKEVRAYDVQVHATERGYRTKRKKSGR
jgi:transcriptional regulator with XRE-family HTH domain